MNRRDDCAEPLFATDSCEYVRSYAYGRFRSQLTLWTLIKANEKRINPPYLTLFACVRVYSRFDIDLFGSGHAGLGKGNMGAAILYLEGNYSAPLVFCPLAALLRCSNPHI